MFGNNKIKANETAFLENKRATASKSYFWRVEVEGV